MSPTLLAISQQLAAAAATPWSGGTVFRARKFTVARFETAEPADG